MYIGLLSALAVPAIIFSAIVRGGPLLRLFSIAVQRADGGQPSRRRCLVRATVAWTPGPIGIPLGILTFQDASELEPATWTLTALVGTGSLYAIWRPDCGIPDTSAGTRLVPR